MLGDGRGKEDFRWIEVQQLTFGAEYQSKIRPARVAHLRQNLRRDGLGVVEVSERESGDLVMIDGQHRATAVAQVWGPTTKVLCRVVHGLTREAEAARFRMLNDKRTVRKIDDFRAASIARDPEVIAIETILERNGVRWGHSASAGVISAVDKLQVLYRLDPRVLDETIATVKGAWDVRPGTWNGAILHGVGLFLVRYRDADREALRHKLAVFPGGPEGFLGEARGWRALYHIDLARAVGQLCVERYNRGRPLSTRLLRWA